MQAPRKVLPPSPSLNLHRRHLNESQRAMVAARLATLGKGRPSEKDSIESITRDDAADLLAGVGHPPCVDNFWLL